MVFVSWFRTDPSTNMGLGFIGVALAFGLSILILTFAFYQISGAHFNPALTLAAALAGRLEWKLVLPYSIAQIVSATASGALLSYIASAQTEDGPGALSLVANGYGQHSPMGYSLPAALVTEAILTAVLVFVFLGSTDRRAPTGIAPILIGLGLTLIHLVSIPVTNASVNPARSIGVAWFSGYEALGQIWLFILAPTIGAAISGVVYKNSFSEEEEPCIYPACQDRARSVFHSTPTTTQTVQEQGHLRHDEYQCLETNSF